jgi:hypothetical protein
MLTALIERPAPAATRVLRCASRACDHRPLGELRGETLVIYGGATVGPVQPGAVAALKCPRCHRVNRFWL